MGELNDQQRVALLTVRLGLPEGSLDPQVALEALRHGSYAHERSLAPGRPVLRSNERLEFLGDSILGFLIARQVYERSREASEGELTRLRAALVREESLAIVARSLGLGHLLLLGRGEQRSGGRENAGRLADALEAPEAVERALLDEAITLVPSDSAWPDLAADESARLRAALVDADIEHVGSTAVPGLDGKSIIDLLVGVRELTPSLRIPDYEALGEAGVAGRLYF